MIVALELFVFYHPPPFLTQGRGGRGGHGTPSKVLFVRNLSLETEPDSLQEVFTSATDIYLPKDKNTGERRG